MAKTSLINKCNAEPKFAVRKYNRCKRCGRPRAFIRKFQICASRRGADHCLNDKLAVMEVCPDHVLEGLQERKKWYLRAEVIDNQKIGRAHV